MSFLGVVYSFQRIQTHPPYFHFCPCFNVAPLLNLPAPPCTIFLPPCSPLLLEVFLYHVLLYVTLSLIFLPLLTDSLDCKRLILCFPLPPHSLSPLLPFLSRSQAHPFHFLFPDPIRPSATMMHSLRTTTLLLALVAVASSFAPITANASLDEAMAIRNHQNFRARRNTVNSIVSGHGSALRRKRQLQASQELAARQIDDGKVGLVAAEVAPVDETDETDASDETDTVDEVDEDEEDDEEEEEEEDEEDSGDEATASPTAAATAAATPTGDSNSTLTTNSTLISNSTTAAPTNGTSTASSPFATITLTTIINHVAIVNETSTQYLSESTITTEIPASTATETEISTEYRTSTQTNVNVHLAAPTAKGKSKKKSCRNKKNRNKNKKTSPSTPTTSNDDTSETTTNTETTDSSSSGSGLLSGASDIVENGQMTYFAVGLGACGYTDQDSDFIVALPVGLWNAIGGENVWQGNKVCNRKLKVSNGSKAIEVTIRDQCPSCDNNHIDLSPSAFSALANLEQGLVSVSWGWVGGQP